LKNFIKANNLIDSDMMFKRGFLLFVMLSSLLLITSCSTSTSSSSSIDVMDTLENVWDAVLDIGMLKFLKISSENALSGFMRLMIGILVFTLIFEATRLLGDYANRNARVVVAVIISIISVIFMPKKILLAIGSTYSIIVSIIMIGVPVAAGFYALYRIPSDNRWQVGMKVFILGILLWIMFVVRDYALGLYKVV